MKPIKPIDIYELFGNLRKKLDNFFGPTETGSEAQMAKVNLAMCEKHFQRAMNERSLAEAERAAAKAATVVDAVDDLVVL